MKGEVVKERLLKEGYILADVARAMGIIPQNLQTLLSANDIKTGVLEKIAQAINKKAYFFFEENGHLDTSLNEEAMNRQLDIISKQTEQLSKSQEQIDRLLTIIENLSEQLRVGGNPAKTLQ